MLANIRLAFRQFIKSPGFSFVAVLALALGIGANTAMFSIINTVFLRPLPYTHPEQLVQLTSSVPERQIIQAGFSWPRLRAVQEQQQVFTDIAVSVQNAFTLTGRGDPEQVQGMQVTANYFALLGVQPLHGRNFLAEEDRPDGASVVLLSHAYWQRSFAGQPGVIGQSLTLDGKPHTIIGVLPPSLSAFPLNQIQIWTARPDAVSFLAPQQVDNGGFFFNVTARLKPGISIEQAREAVKVIAAGYAQAHKSNIDATSRADVDFALDILIGNQRQTFALLFGAVGCVLLIACANVANLLLARFSSRRREIAIRFALGAKRAQVVGQFLTESLLLTIVGGLLGLLFASWSLELFVRLGRNFIPRAEEISLDSWVLTFTLGVSLLTGLIMGLLPAMHAARHDVKNEALKESSRGSSGDGRSHRFRSGLLVGEVALSFVLLITASLLISSFVRLQNVSPGFKPKGIFTGFLVVPPTQYPVRSEALANFYSRLYHRLAAIPGAKSVAFSDNPPLSGNGGQSPYAVIGRALPPLGERPLAIRHLISPNRFSTLGISIKSGRDFSERDTPKSPAVIIINEAMAKQLFPNENPLGRTLVTGMMQLPAEIVGVTADTRTASLTTAPVPEMFYPVFQRPENFTVLLVQTEGDPTGLLASVRTALHDVDPGLPLTNPGTMDQFVAQSVADRRLTMMLLAVFAGLALVLAAIGIYGVMAYTVSQRTSEIGIRMALGARPGDVQKMVVGQGMKLALLGLGLGLGAALAMTRLITALLFDVSASDPLTYAGISALIITVAALACWIPARRAAHVDPLIALRNE